MRRFAVAILFVAALLAACRPAETVLPETATPQSRTLTVFAAASLTDAFTEIGQNYEAAHPGVTVALNFAGSQTLRTQLEQGAIADIFASANQAQMDTLVGDDLVSADASQIFVTNRLLVILPASNPANVQLLEDLARPGIKLILAAEEVPAGKYARQILSNLDGDPALSPDFSARVLANVVSNETDARQVVAKVQLGEGDAGIVYVSDAVAAPDLLTLSIPDEYNVVAQYPIAVLASAPEAELAAAFVDYVLSAEGQAVLQKWGFTPLHP
jgi:molybdate transport system substrate-binding protein